MCVGAKDIKRYTTCMCVGAETLKDTLHVSLGTLLTSVCVDYTQVIAKRSHDTPSFTPSGRYVRVVGVDIDGVQQLC